MCDLCGKDPCEPIGGKMGDEDVLTVDDWREIHKLWQTFLSANHQIILEARKRQPKPEDKWNIGLPRDAEPFYSIVSSSGKVIAMRIPDQKTAIQICSYHNAPTPRRTSRAKGR